MSHTPTTTSTISPKVIAPAIFNVALIVIVAVLGAITPETFLTLGVYGPLLFVAVSTLGTALAGYIRRDPARG